jgi:hypothetical protein
MPGTPVAAPGGSRYDPEMEARVSRLEADMRDEKAARARLETAVIEIRTMLTIALPQLATKADRNGGIDSLRSEFKADMAEQRSDLKQDMTKLSSELKTELVSGLADKPGKT